MLLIYKITCICIRNIQASESLSQSKPPVLSTQGLLGLCTVSGHGFQENSPAVHRWVGLRRNGPDLITLELPKVRFLHPGPIGILKNVSEVITSILRNIPEKQRHKAEAWGYWKTQARDAQHTQTHTHTNTHTHTHTHPSSGIHWSPHSYRHPEGLLGGNDLQQCHLVGEGAVLPSEVPEGAPERWT